MKRLLLLPFLLSGCSTLNLKEKILRNSAIAGASVVTVMAATKDELSDKDAVAYGASAALVGALASVWYYDPDSELDRMRGETSRLKKELDLVQGGRLIESGGALFGARVPEKYRKLINPGEWKLSEVDEWTEEEENRLVHKDKVMELIPPSLIGR